MKKSTIVKLAVPIFLVCGSSSVLAQSQEVQQQPQAKQQVQAQQPRSLIGKSVATASGEKLGTVQNIVQDNAGSVKYVVLSRGQDGQNNITIPSDSIDLSGEQKTISAKVDLSKIQQFTKSGQQDGVSAEALDQILGKEVQGQQGETLGTINNIVLGTENGPMVILKGENQENYPIPLQALKFKQGDQGFRLSQSKEDFKTAPSYAQAFVDLDRWQNVIHGYYGVQSEQQQNQPPSGQDKADISVRQPAPEVRVEQPQPEVEVRQKQPEVAVRQKQPQVQVTQPEPKVQVTQPQPQVEITQPEPEVKVTQPQPEVQVEQPQPEVQVKQPRPEVKVTQPEPRVKVEQSQPQVQVEKSEPKVSMREEGSPQVTVQRQGQPEVSVQRKGEADVTVQRSQAGQQGRQAQDLSVAQADASQAQKWMNSKVMSNNNQELGTINDIIASEEGKVSYVMIKSQNDAIHPVPAEMLRADSQGKQLRAGFDKEYFQQSPGFSANQQQQMARGDWEQEVRGYYQQAKEGGSQ